MPHGAGRLKGFTTTRFHGEGSEFVNRKECLVLPQLRKRVFDRVHLLSVKRIWAGQRDSCFLPLTSRLLDHGAEIVWRGRKALRLQSRQQIGQSPCGSVKTAIAGWRMEQGENGITQLLAGLQMVGARYDVAASFDHRGQPDPRHETAAST